MSSENIHYEVFVKLTAKGSWKLAEARHDKAEALKLAQAILKASPGASIRVSKEKYVSEEGVFHSFTIFEAGEKYSADDARANKEPELPCRSPADLCKPHARETIGRSLKEWLKRQTATPMELLHRVDLVESLEASGTEFQHAVQKVAIASASSQQANVQKFIKQINELVTRAIEGLYAAHRQNAFPTFKKGELAQAATQLASQTNKDFRLRGSIAEHLRHAKDWRSKMSMAIDVAEEAGQIPGAVGEWASTVIGDYLVDLVEDETARACLLSTVSDLGDELNAFTDMLRAPERAALSDPGRRLARAFAAGRFIDAQRSIARYVLAGLKSPKKLKPGRIRDEIALNRSIADRLVLTVGRLLSQDELVEAFVFRSGRLVDAESIESLVKSCRSPAEEVFALVELEDNIVGDANKAKLSGYIRGRLSAPAIENYMLKSGETPTRRLAELAAMRNAVDDSSFSAQDKAEIGAKIDRYAVELATKIKLLDQVQKRAGPPLQAALNLMQLVEKGLIPRGRIADEARVRATALLGSSEAQQAIGSGDPAQMKIAGEIMRLLGAESQRATAAAQAGKAA